MNSATSYFKSKKALVLALAEAGIAKFDMRRHTSTHVAHPVLILPSQGDVDKAQGVLVAHGYGAGNHFEDNAGGYRVFFCKAGETILANAKAEAGLRTIWEQLPAINGSLPRSEWNVEHWEFRDE